MTIRAAVVGQPVAHSLSPVLHRAAYAEFGFGAYQYGRIECDQTGLADLLTGLRSHGSGDTWIGLSLTMPLKRVALELAAEVSSLAQAVGAANTLTPVAGGWRADNTDVHGLVEALREAGVTRPVQPLVLGAGGTAQAALAALVELGHTEPIVVVRDLARVGALRESAERLGSRPDIRAGLHTEPLPGADVVISTLPGGAADQLRVAPSPGVITVLDVVYAPWPTAFAAAAGRDGAVVVSGLLMLLHQAVAQVALMTGRPGPVPAMRAALAAAVGSVSSTGSTAITGSTAVTEPSE